MQNETVHNTFDDIQHTPLRVFNRVMFMMNLNQSVSPEEGKAYAESFSEGEKKQMYVMGAFIKKNGLDKTRKVVTGGLTVV